MVTIAREENCPVECDFPLRSDRASPHRSKPDQSFFASNCTRLRLCLGCCPDRRELSIQVSMTISLASKKQKKESNFHLPKLRT